MIPDDKPLTHAEMDRLIEEEAHRAVAGAIRRPSNVRPANATPDHEVAFALGDVKRAAKSAAALGATLEELINAVEDGESAARLRASSPS